MYAETRFTPCALSTCAFTGVLSPITFTDGSTFTEGPDDSANRHPIAITKRTTNAMRAFMCFGTNYFLTQESIQSMTVLYQSTLFCGFSTQWPSSGNSSNFDGTFCI